LSRQRPQLIFQSSSSAGQPGLQLAKEILRVPVDLEKGQLSLPEMFGLVAGNNLLNGELSIDVLKNKANERLAKSSRLSLDAGVFLNNGKLSFSGGMSGVFQDIVAGVKTGNAIGAAVPVVFNFAGQIMDIITGKKGKQKELALKMTQISQHRMEDAVVGQVHEASVLFIEISRARKQIAHLQTVVEDLEEAPKVLAAREAGGFSVTAEHNALSQQIGEYRAQISSWQEKQKTATMELNQMLGRSTEHLQDELAPQLVWDGEFTAMTDKVKEAKLAQLTGLGSPNYRLKGAQVALEAVEQTIRLQGLEFLPSVDLTGLFVPGAPGQPMNPLFDLTPGSKMRTSVLRTGPNGAINFEIPLIDTGRKAREEIALLERTKAQLHMKVVKTELGGELARVAAETHELSRQIAQAEEERRAAEQAWRLKVDRPDFYRKDQAVEERLRIARIAQRIVDLKADYFKGEARLRRLQLLGYNEMLVRPSTASSLAARIVAPDGRALSVDHPALTMEGLDGRLLSLDLPDADTGRSDAGSGPQRPGVLCSGSVTYPATRSTDGKDGFNLWTLMRGKDGEAGRESRLDIALRILIEEPNIVVRQKTMDFLVEELQNEGRFQERLEQVILTTPYSEVAENLLAFVVHRDGHDVRLLVQYIGKAMEQGKADVVRTGFQMLNDILLQDPGAVEQLAGFVPSTDTKGISVHLQDPVDSLRRIMLTFLAWTPEDSLAKVRSLQSDYWTTDQLAQIYGNLIRSQDNVPQGLAGLLYDEIIRRQALVNIDEVFHPGPFADLTSMVFDKDLRAAVMLREYGEADRRFLRTSPRWREMKNFISPVLYERAKKSAEAVVQERRKASGPALLGSDIVDIGGDETIGLVYFHTLNIEEQKKFIARTNDVPLLTRIFRSQTPLRSLALNRLMTTALGRVLVLQIYQGTEDKEVTRLVEKYPWADVLRADIRAADNPVSMDVYRQAMEKMAARTGEEVFLNIRLATYSLPELHAANDPRGDGPRRRQIQMTATRLALDVLAERAKNQPRWVSGQAVHTAREQALLDELRQRIGIVHDPEEFNVYFDKLGLQADETTRPVLTDIKKQRDSFIEAIGRNDQSFPSITIWSKIVLGLAGGLFAFFASRNKFKGLWRRVAGNDSMIRSLRREFEAESGNGNGRPNGRGLATDVVVIPDKGLDETFTGPLQNWRNIVSRWRHEQPGAPVIIEDMTLILNSAFEVLRKAPYDPELMFREGPGPASNERYQTALSYLNLLSIDTFNALNDLLQGDNTGLDDYQREKLLNAVQMLKRTMEYATTYLRILEYRWIIDTVMSYKFADSSLAERLKIYPFMRWVLLYSYQLGKSQKRIQKELPDLLRQGNELMPSLYGDPDDIVERNKGLLSTAIKTASNLTSLGTLTARNNSKVRRFASRLRLFAVPVGVAALSAMGLLGIPGTAGLSLFGALAVAVSLGIFWIPNMNMMEMSWSQTMKRVAGNLVSGLRERLGGAPAGEAQPRDEEQGSVKLAVEDGMKKLRRELSPKSKRSVDMVVMLSEDPSTDEVDSLKRYVEGRRGIVFRKDVPVEVLPTRRKGSGNAYLEAVATLKERLQDADFIRQYPHLQGVDWKDMKVMFVFASNQELRNDGLLDWGVINGYRTSVCADGPCSGSSAAQESPTADEARGRHILIYSRDAYFGPVQGFEEGDIGLMGNWVDAKALKSLGLLNVDVTQKWPRVKELLEKLDVEMLRNSREQRIHPSKIMQYLRRNYDLGNSSLKQYPAMTGVMALGPRVVGAVGDLLKHLEKKPDLVARLKYLNFTNDILNIFVKPESETIRDYPEVRVDWDDVHHNYDEPEKDNLYELFRSFYATLSHAKRHKAPGGMAVSATIPYPGEAVLVHVDGADDLAKVNELLRQQGGGGAELPWLTPGMSLPQADIAEPPAVLPEAALAGGGESDSGKERSPSQVKELISDLQEPRAKMPVPQEEPEAEVQLSSPGHPPAIESSGKDPVMEVGQAASEESVTGRGAEHSFSEGPVAISAPEAKMPVQQQAPADEPQVSAPSERPAEGTLGEVQVPNREPVLAASMGQDFPIAGDPLTQERISAQMALERAERRKKAADAEVASLRARKYGNQLDWITPINTAVDGGVKAQIEIEKLQAKIADIEKRMAASGTSLGAANGSARTAEQIKVAQDELRQVDPILRKVSDALEGAADIAVVKEEEVGKLEPYVVDILAFAKSSGMAGDETGRLENTLSGWKLPGQERKDSATPYQNFKAGIDLLRDSGNLSGREELVQEMRSVIQVMQKMVACRIVENERALAGVPAGSGAGGGPDPDAAERVIARRASAVQTKNGGGDLSDAAGSVRFESGGRAASDESFSSLTRIDQVLQSFRGFDFDILSLQPFTEVLNAVSFLPFP
ncbi:MAG: hypothetical protein HQL18_01680, partial [Candidatus Omnitrophica bacterium]|nr:hypothetical protein [Candidatus Omnitrophota bacterium]